MRQTFKEIIKDIETHPNFQVVNLSSQKLNADNVVELCRALKSSASISHLHFSECSIQGRVSVKEITSYLAGNRTLKSLNLSANFILDESMNLIL
ncbi:MAG: hypothetical protein ACK5WS_00960 [Alphaproteobacteria bacterium]|jgi:hypothetical protein